MHHNPLAFTRPGGGEASGGSLRSSRQAAAWHPFTRSWATMPPEAPPLPGLLPPHGLSRCFFRDMCLPPPDLGPPPDAVAGRSHAAGLQETDLQGVIKHGVETWPKNGCASTLLQNWYLIISELRILSWPHPDWFSCCQAQLFHRNK